MAAPFLITFCFICWVCVDVVWMNGSSWPGLRVNCVYTCACTTHSTTFDWISQRERERDIHPFSLAPPPLVTACIIDPEQLHFLSMSKLIRCSAFTYPGPIRPSSSFLWKAHFPPIYLCLCSFSSKTFLYHSCADVFLNPLCIFQHCSCLILIWTLFCWFLFPFLYLNHLSSFSLVVTAVSSTSVNLWLSLFRSKLLFSQC